jgi:DNA-binding NarL/FixJ family response regulator
MSAPTVVLADADLVTRTGVRVTLGDAGFVVAGEADDAGRAAALVNTVRPDLVVVAAELPGGGVDAVRRIAGAQPATRVLMLSRRPEGAELVAAVQAGADGYVPAEVGLERLPHVLRAVLAGEMALPRRLTRHLVEALSGRDSVRRALDAHSSARVTDREWEVLQLLADGRSSAEIAGRLGISEVTVRRHASAAAAKLGTRSRAEAIRIIRERSGR